MVGNDVDDAMMMARENWSRIRFNGTRFLLARFFESVQAPATSEGHLCAAHTRGNNITVEISVQNGENFLENVWMHESTTSTCAYVTI